MSAAPLGRVLVTGAGGPAAVTVLRSLAGHAELVAGDIDPFAVGLYLVPEENRVLLPRGDDPEFVATLLQCARERRVDVVVPTVDSELRGVSAAREQFAAHGIELLVESTRTLDLCLDKLTLVRHCDQAGVAVPQTLLLDAGSSFDDLALLGTPFIVKPRQGAGGRGVVVVRTPDDLHGLPLDETLIAQQLLPGDEFSIDVLGSPDGRIVAAVPRRRDKVDSGIAVAGRTMRDSALENFGRAVAAAIGVAGVVNVQAKLDASGVPALLEVNARFPGTMSLTQAAGIDMPLLAVSALRGQSLPDSLSFSEIAVVRHWCEVAVPVEQYASVPRARVAADVVP